MNKFSLKNYFNKRRVLEFLDSKGFYIVLVLCICIVSATAYVVTKRNLESYQESSNISDVTKVTNPNYKSAVNKPSDSTAINQTTNKPSATNKAAKTSNTNTIQFVSKDIKEQKPITKIDMPIIGDIIKDFAKTSLIYSKTLEQWTTHEGIDIYSDRGTPVKAAYDGTVENIYSDYKYGITIIIDSGQGIKTKYSNLSTDSMVKKGQKVKTGEVISGVGNTAMFESGEDPHLHFEVIENGNNVNPKNYLK